MCIRDRGSGGAVRLVAPVVAGSGSLNVAGSTNRTYNEIMAHGGGGRIRIDCMNRHALALSLLNGPATIGANMVAIPTNALRLDVIQAAGHSIPFDTGTPVLFTLSEGSSTNQTVTVQASNFNGVVPIRVVLTPDHGPNSSYDAQIDNTTVNPASVTVPVVVPVNEQVQVNAWTR